MICLVSTEILSFISLLHSLGDSHLSPFVFSDPLSVSPFDSDIPTDMTPLHLQLTTYIWSDICFISCKRDNNCSSMLYRGVELISDIMDEAKKDRIRIDSVVFMIIQ